MDFQAFSCFFDFRDAKSSITITSFLDLTGVGNFDDGGGHYLYQHVWQEQHYKVDEARLNLFARKQRSYDAIPPTSASLIQHVERSAFQAACIWGQATVCKMKNESPAHWGWHKDGEVWQVLWTTLPPIAQSCEQLTNATARLNAEDDANAIALA